MDIELLLEELYSYSLHGIKLGLSNIEMICKEMGNPQNDYKVIHIAGTNGKGSTSTTVEKVLVENGNSVGKYTSPHILKFNERICLNGTEISDEEIAEYYSYVKEVVRKLGITPTFFEVTTAMMFKYFSDKKAEYVILEVGMGGKYDATNIADGDICVVTNVSLDHIEFLGNSICDIAKEKAGIIKRKSKVIVGCDDKEFLKAIEEKTSNYTNVLDKYKDGKYRLDFKSFITKIELEGKEYNFSLFGDYQYKNFLCAYEVLKELEISDEIIQRGITKVSWPCRFEVLKNEKIIILDGAHNGEGAKTLCETIKKGYEKKDIIAVVAILKDKDSKSIINILDECVGDIIYTSLKENKRGQSAKELYDLDSNKTGKLYEEDLKEAYRLALSVPNKKVVLICGSFYLLSKFKEEVLLNEK
nr:folylpolyglutamate synthase/dihydrofolate synthase family protein [uncultured Cetobacterium sp.]